MITVAKQSALTQLQILLSCILCISSFGVLAVQYTTDRSSKALTHVQKSMSAKMEEEFFLGRSFVNTIWVGAPSSTTARDGLGPLFNANSCVACHKKNMGGGGYGPGGQVPVSTVLRLKTYNSINKQWIDHPTYGNQLSVHGTTKVPYEVRFHIRMQTNPNNQQLIYPEVVFDQLNYGPLDSQTEVQLLRAPALIGLGLLEQIPASQIKAMADPADKNDDGISGRTRLVWSRTLNSLQLGRFGWKASTASVIEQSAKAAINDIGLTNPLFSAENCTAMQTACLDAYSDAEFDLPYQRLKAITTYLTHLRIPSPASQNSAGKDLFDNIGCSGCHSNLYSTRSGQPIPAYTDMLLHDMGSDLSGTGPLAREWRTAPLWGIGLAQHLQRPAYLHDGRADNLQDAVLWHGGEAMASKESFERLTLIQKQQLIDFLESL